MIAETILNEYKIFWRSKMKLLEDILMTLFLMVIVAYALRSFFYIAGYDAGKLADHQYNKCVDFNYASESICHRIYLE